MLRGSLYRRVIGISLGAAVLAALGVGFFGEAYFRSNLEKERDRGFAEVESRVELLDLMLGKAENAMLGQGRIALETLAKDYGDPRGLERLGQADLGLLARKLGVEDLYLIDSGNKVAATSLYIDQGLDLGQYGPSFTAFLDKVRGSGQVFDERLTVSGQTGAIKAYQYYSPKGSSWILETSSGLDAWFPRFVGGMAYRDFISILFKPFMEGSEGKPLISFDIVRWSRSGSWSLVRPGTRRYIDESWVRKALAKGEYHERRGKREFHYRILSWKGQNPGFADTRIAELVVDLSLLDRFTRSILIAGVLACLAAALFAFIAARSFFDRSFVTRIEDLQSAIKRVAAGEEGVSFGSGGEDELSFIGKSIADMIEEVRRTEEELRNARAAEAVGVMAGGLAHDISNLLAGAVGAASILRNRLEEEGSVPAEELSSSLGLIEHTGERGEVLVRDLLALARVDRPPPYPVDLCALAGEVVDFMRVSAPASVRIDLELPQTGAEALGSAEDLERILMNLCRNGIQAMTDMRPPEVKRGGVLTISISPRDGEGMDPPSWAIAVKDQGVGMGPEVRARLFTPFFSTKSRRGGSGLGLAASRAIAEAHGGHIEVDSVPGAGTTFALVLPMSKGGAC